jgi:hypothetical protein
VTWRHYLTNLAVAVNQGINALLAGEPDEMLSARAHRRHLAGHSGARNAINRLFFWQPDHCLTAFEQEAKRKQLPATYRV